MQVSSSLSSALGAERVLVVAPQPFYEDRGTPIAVRQLLHALATLGVGCDVVTYPVGGDPQIDGVRLYRGANPFGYRSVAIGLSMRKLILDATLIPQIIRRLRD